MNQLVIDDLRTLGDMPHARTSAEGLEMLRASQGLNILWLDHDLGGGDTIMPVLDWLCERSFLGDPFPVGEIRVHSMNPVGASFVVRSLERYGYNVRRVRWSGR